MSKLNIIQFNYHQKLKIRREMLRKSQIRYAKKIAFQLKNNLANDNILTTINMQKEKIKL